MKIISKLVSALILASATAGAMATPITSNTVTLNQEVTHLSPLTFAIDMTDDTMAYAPNTPFSGATLHLLLSDPDVAGFSDSNEKINVYFGNFGILGGSVTNVNSNGDALFDFTLDAAGIADFLADGILNVKLGAGLQGGNSATANYYAKNAYLTLDTSAAGGGGANGAVPEPASLGLFGITLAGLAAIRRRKQK